jgi:large subunit ribosomal protein L15
LEHFDFYRLYYYIAKNRLDPTQTITMKMLFECGMFGRIKHGVKLLGRGSHLIDRPLNFELTDATESAIKAVKEKGGSVTCIYKTD